VSPLPKPDSPDAVKPWRVLHACETASAAAALAEIQSGVGMNPQLLSREYWNPAGAMKEVSLMNAWHDVRDWRHALNDAEALTSVQIVHAHSFASAMAGVRGTLPLVYDFGATLENIATHHSHGNSGPWLLRSFRVAEQFALSRASAVVTHSTAMKKMANERGAASENIFVVPEAVPVSDVAIDRDWVLDHALDVGYDVVLFALPDPRGIEVQLRWMAGVSSELENAVFVIEYDDADTERLIKLARELNIADALRCVTQSERREAIGCANVVIAPPVSEGGALTNVAMLQAMAAGKAVVAADVPENRECSPDGQGCVWFKPGDDLDLTQRIAFVGRNRDFANALGESGRAHIALRRAPTVVGKQYDEVYRHAHSRRNDTNATRVEMPKIYALGMQIL
jgi:glycosyltransferase involved in cell wall biosynthesis